MSDYTLKLKHKKSGEIHSVEAIDGYFGEHVYGYRLPNNLVVYADNLGELYEGEGE